MNYRAIFLILVTVSFCHGQKKSSMNDLVTAFLKKATDTTQIHTLKKILGRDMGKYQDHFQFIPSLNPVNPERSKRMASEFGRRFHPIDNKYKQHFGVDISAKPGTPVHAAADGTVEKAFRSNDGYGNQVIIRHKFGFKTRYAHLYTFIVKKGANIKKGDIIAFIGNTGKSTGFHLHYEVIKNDKPVDPYPFCFLEL